MLTKVPFAARVKLKRALQPLADRTLPELPEGTEGTIRGILKSKFVPCHPLFRILARGIPTERLRHEYYVEVLAYFDEFAILPPLTEA